MSSTKRRINSTGRKRIPRELVDIRMHPIKDDEPLAASGTFALNGLGFPADSSVVLEAYQRSSGMRFNCGTVGNLQVPPTLYLNEIDRDTTVLFRLKVIQADAGSGRLLGSADRLRPSDSNDAPGRRSIFPIKERALGDEVWRVELDDAGPVLLLNSRIPGFKHRILENSLITGIMLPTAFRTVLQHLVRDSVVDDDDQDDWRILWLRYLKEELSIDDDLAGLSPDEHDEWVETAVRKFCQTHEFVDRIRAADEAAK
jgi:hypothetical protein